MGKRKLEFSSPSQSRLTKCFSSANSSNVVSETSSSPKPSSSNKGASTNVTPCSVVSFSQIKIKSIKHTM
jgi:hypothetical protein